MGQMVGLRKRIYSNLLLCKRNIFPTKGNSALIKQNHYHRESRETFKVSNPGL